MELHQSVEAIKASHGLTLQLIRIPREVMEKNRKSALFLAPAYLHAEPVYHTDGTVDMRLTEFIPDFAEIPSKQLDKMRDLAAESPFDFIDFWAVDFAWGDMPDKPFTHHWQDYRTSRDRTLLTESRARYQYAEPGEYFACVRVVDVFGCDTDITVKVEVPHGSITP